MYGLKQAAVLAYTQLANHLKDNDYRQIIGSMGMWKHETKNNEHWEIENTKIDLHQYYNTRYSYCVFVSEELYLITNLSEWSVQ